MLDNIFLESLGIYDIVYSWGVLHHTGQMHLAIDNAHQLTAKDGLLFISIYNDKGFKSHLWWMIKYFYNHLPRFFRKPFAYGSHFIVKLLLLIIFTIKLKPMVILSGIFNYQKFRGMDFLTDIVDWYGGFPFEFSKYEYLVDYIESKGYQLVNGEKTNSSGCHQLVLKRIQ